jgi:hypothetical protein
MMTLFLSRFPSGKIIIAVTVLTISTTAMAQLPENMPPVGAQPAPAASLADTASGAISTLADKASQLGQAVIPDSVAIPGLAPAPTAVGANAPEGFTQGQDRSVTVTSQGKPESIFFTPNQLASIMRAQQGFLVPREAFDPNNQGAEPTTGGSRVVSLAGIIYVNSKDWVIWLNGERVTRKNMPQRLIGLTVRPTLAHLRWLDVPNQRIVNITLRPHQQYLLDSDTIIPAP